jgi:hypothetical protein
MLANELCSYIYLCKYILLKRYDTALKYLNFSVSIYVILARNLIFDASYLTNQYHHSLRQYNNFLKV